MATDRTLVFREHHGLGPILFRWQKGRTGCLIATAGADCSVAIFNRQGVLQERIILLGSCVDLDWDSEGDLLGIVVQNSNQLVLWDANTKKKQHIDLGLRDCPSILVWSVTKPVVAVGTTKGNLSIYNHLTQRRTPILGKHSKRISGGCWSKTNQLALISDDRTLSISNEDGDSLRIVQLSDTPSDLRYAKLGKDERGTGEENLLSLILGRRVLFLYNLSEPDAPIELGFQQHYGEIERHVWFGQGFIALAFSRGFLITVSTNPRELGQELTQIRAHPDSLADFDLNDADGESEVIVTCGLDTAKIYPLASVASANENVKTLTGNEEIHRVRLSYDGQLLALSTSQGGFTIFVTQLSTLFAVCSPKIAVLTNLSEVSIYTFDPDTKGYRNLLQRPSIVGLELEPDFIGVGPAHLACGLNNHVVFYDFGRTQDRPLQLETREFHSQVSNIKMTETLCSVLCGGQVVLQAIESHGSGAKEPQIFPDSVNGLSHTVISDHCITNHFLILSTDLGHLIHFDLRSWVVVLQHRNDIGIKTIYSDRNGIRVIFLDDHGKASLYLAAPFAGDSVLPIADSQANLTNFLWDSHDNDLFIGFNKMSCWIFIFVKHSLDGAKVVKVAEMKLLSGVPLLISRGEMVVMNDAERMTTLQLVTHSRQENKIKRLEMLRKMHKLEESWELCKALNDRKEFESLYEVAVETLNIRFALRVQRHLGNVAQVKFLEEIQDYDDIRLLQGFCAILLNKTEVAQQILLKSATSLNHYEALELCRDLLLWEQALTMAHQIAPQEVFAISLEYAQQLEFSDNFRESLLRYENSLAFRKSNTPAKVSKDHEKLALCGLARMSIRCGDFDKGVLIARELKDPLLLSECGHLLANAKQYPEAVKLFELGRHYEDACKLHIQMKAWKQVEKLLPHIDSPQLHLDFAKASEQENRLEEALRHYKFANDIDNVVRLHLMLNDAHSAQEAILEMPSVTGSKLLANFYQKMGDYEEAIRFLVQCDSIDEAFQCAKLHKKLPFFGEHLEKSDNAKLRDFRELAEIFESEKYTFLAGKYYFLAREFPKALKFLMKASAFDADEKNISLSLAIDCVAMGSETDHSGQLTKQLIEFLLGETDGVPKDPRFLFRLYMAKKEFRDAAKIAVVIAQQEQTTGNYRSAHDLLFQMSEELRQNQLQVGAELRSSLVLLHRYIVARIHVKLGNHDLAARLLSIVAENVSRFPSHTVPILTSTVIECQRANLREMAFKFASQLMRPEFRVAIAPKYAKKIEAIVRRRAPKGEEGGMEGDQVSTSALLMSSPCPFCGTDVEATELNCYQCKETIPMCIASGLHVSKEVSLGMCPKCQSLCLRDVMVSVLEVTNSCPMCGEALEAGELVEVKDWQEWWEEHQEGN